MLKRYIVQVGLVEWWLLRCWSVWSFYPREKWTSLRTACTERVERDLIPPFCSNNTVPKNMTVEAGYYDQESLEELFGSYVTFTEDGYAHPSGAAYHWVFQQTLSSLC